MKTDDLIKVKAEVIDSRRCRFVVDRPILRMGGSLQFRDKGDAKGFPLAAALFEMDEVIGLLLAGDKVVVEKRGEEAWTSFGKKVGGVIRSAIQNEAALIASGMNVPLSVAVEERIRTKMEHLLKTEINPSVAGHGGQVTLLDVKGSVVYIKMGGGCQGCGSASVTLKEGIEKTIHQYVPEVTEILDITDHAGGKNPYYAQN